MLLPPCCRTAISWALALLWMAFLLIAASHHLHRTWHGDETGASHQCIACSLVKSACVAVFVTPVFLFPVLRTMTRRECFPFFKAEKFESFALPGRAPPLRRFRSYRE